MGILIANWALNYVVLAALVVLKWSTIQNLSGVEAITPSILILLGAIALISLVGKLLGHIVGFFAIITIILAFFFSFIVGWVELGFIEHLNLGYNYIESTWYQNALVYFLLGINITKKTSSSTTN
jgi:hypothetical protein